MSPRDRYNGGDVAQDPFPSLPVRNPVPERTPLRETFTPIEPETVTGVVARRLVDQVAAVVTRVDQNNGDMHKLGETVVSGFNELKVMLRLPPMRAESPSSDAVPVHARKSFSQYVRQRAKDTPGGPDVVQVPPEELEQAAQDYFEQQMAIYERGQELKRLQQQEAAQKLERERKASDRRTLIILTLSGTIAALAGVLGTYFATRAAAHESGFAEGLKAAPTATVMVAAPPASVWAAAPTIQVIPGGSAAGIGYEAPHKPVPAPPAPAAAAPAH
jgi:hypothetical protein